MNRSDRSYAMMVLTPMRPCLRIVSHFLFTLCRALPLSVQKVLGIPSHQFIRWVVISPKQWPDLGQPAERLENDYTLFVSNFRRRVVSRRKKSGLVKKASLLSFVRGTHLVTEYFYSAIPTAKSEELAKAIRNRQQYEVLKQAYAAGPEAFHQAWRRLQER